MADQYNEMERKRKFDEEDTEQQHSTQTKTAALDMRQLRAEKKQQQMMRVLHPRRVINLPDPVFGYGKSSFGYFMSQNYAFVDNSRYLLQLPKTGSELIFLRPARFGKSLFVSMLSCWHDLAVPWKDFYRAFHNLDVFRAYEGSENLTEESDEVEVRRVFADHEARSWHVLKLDMSSIATTSDCNAIKENMDAEIICSIKRFCKTYSMTEGGIIVPNNAMQSLKNVAEEVGSRNGQLYVTVDEYDRFANQLMVNDADVYNTLVQKGDMCSGPIRSLFQTLKSLQEILGTNPFRSYTTGISPITLADASGANNLQYISLKHAAYADMLGFTEADLKSILASMLFDEVEQGQLLGTMRRLYNGYRFVGGQEALFNPTQCISFLQGISDGTEEMLNAALSGKVLSRNPEHIRERNIGAELFHDSNVVASLSMLNLLRASRNSALEKYMIQAGHWSRNVFVPINKLSLDPFKLSQLMGQFGSSESTNLGLSLMYYHGLLTLSETQPINSTAYHMKIPNCLLEYLAALHICNAESTIPDLHNLVLNPTVLGLNNLLQGIFKVPKDNDPVQIHPVFDANYNECAMEEAIARTIGIWITANKQNGVTIEGLDDEHILLSSPVLLANNGTIHHAVLIELKCIRPNNINWTMIPEKQHWSQGDLVNWRKCEKELRDYCKNLEMAQMLQIRQKKMFNIAEATVAEIIETAKRQALNHKTKMEKSKRFEKITAFTAVLVATRVVVNVVDE